MKGKLLCFVLVASVAAFGQRGSHPSGGMGGQMGGGMGQMGGQMGQMGGSMGNRGGGPGMMDSSNGHGNGMGTTSETMNSRANGIAKSSPDTILSRNTQLSSNLDKLLPEGTTAQQACSGYKNLGQCVAAIHVANNLGIPFTDLKAKTTGSGSVSLGKAIHELKPDVNAKTEIKKAKKQTQADLKTANS